MTNISQKRLIELDELIIFSRNYSAKITASKIAKISNIPQKTVSRKMNLLCSMGLLKFEREGRNKLYFLDLNDIRVKELLAALESYKAINFLVTSKKIAIMLNELTRICPVVVFGSYAKGTQTTASDLDLLIFGEKKKVGDIIKKYPFEVNPQISSLKEYQRLLKEKNTLALEIKENHIILNQIEIFVDLFMKNG